jgi:hypothetical protein
MPIGPATTPASNELSVNTERATEALIRIAVRCQQDNATAFGKLL